MWNTERLGVTLPTCILVSSMDTYSQPFSELKIKPTKTKVGILLATVVAKNGAGGFSRAVQSDPVEVVLKALQPGRIWNVGRELRALKK